MSTVFTLYTLFIGYQLFFQSKEKRFNIAGNMQGYGLSQAMFTILNWQHPNYSDPYFERSVAFNKRGDYATGFQFLDKAVELDPVRHLGYRGYMKLRFLRDYQGALADFDRLDTLTPEVVDAPWGEDIDFLRGECFYGLGKYVDALKHFKQSVENQGVDWADVQTFVYQGLCETALGNNENAISAYEQALQQYESTCEAYFGLAHVYLQLGDTTKAKEALGNAGKYIEYKRNDPYKEFLNEIYVQDIRILLKSLENY